MRHQLGADGNVSRGMRARVQLGNLPDPCLAPVVFLTSPSGAWFAVSGVDG